MDQMPYEVLVQRLDPLDNSMPNLLYVVLVSDWWPVTMKIIEVQTCMHKDTIFSHPQR